MDKALLTEFIWEFGCLEKSTGASLLSTLMRIKKVISAHRVILGKYPEKQHIDGYSIGNNIVLFFGDTTRSRGKVYPHYSGGIKE